VICAFVNGRTSRRKPVIAPIELPSRSMDCHDRPRTDPLPWGPVVLGLRRHVADLHDTAFEDGAARDSVSAEGMGNGAVNMSSSTTVRPWAAGRVARLPSRAHHGAEGRVTQADRATGDRVEHGLRRSAGC
jgi:hypothetical protein